MNTTNLLDQIEQPLAALNSQPSTLSSLWAWSLQFEIPIWLPLLLALGLGVALYLQGLAHGRRTERQNVAANKRQHRATSLFSSLR